MAEIEIGTLSMQCLSRSLFSFDLMTLSGQRMDFVLKFCLLYCLLENSLVMLDVNSENSILLSCYFHIFADQCSVILSHSYRGVI